ncbi:hypothetical protein Nepgr_026834 [Nepenthes gracilis]|uniref:GDSL esterase/lipase n=1 Tax=Nepenthes gracilis TaxID=150966 RepID=A0AAD3Y2X2_NEPGR|nr:hypothetical protein Nepgr_026834 [Nepenthes gracilis]
MGIVSLLLLLMVFESTGTSTAQMVPAMFVFGDSLVDVGNNNYLEISLAKANFPHNGIDFPSHRPTGRFSNGKNSADFLAEKLGLPSSPPYLSLVHNKSTNFLAGVSFASGGAGIFNGTAQIFGQSIPMTKQIDYFAAVREEMVEQLGETGAEKVLSTALFAVVIGSNDILGHFSSDSNSSSGSGSGGATTTTAEQMVSSMIVTIEQQLKRIYDLGGRKYAMIGVGAVGCCPTQRARSQTMECNAVANHWATEYNRGLVLVLEQLSSELHGFVYSYFDTYTAFSNFIQNPSNYGFKEVKAACCGLGTLKAQVACLPISSYCSNRSDHVFWDLFHPTEAASRLFVGMAFDGSGQFASPVNLRQLIAA